MKPKGYLLDNYQVIADFSPAKEIIGDYTTRPAKNDTLELFRDEDNTKYFWLNIGEIKQAFPESEYPLQIVPLAAQNKMDIVKCLYESYDGKAGIFAILQSQETKLVWFLAVWAPFAPKGSVVGPAVSVLTGLSLFAVARILSSIKIKRLV